MSVRNAVVAIFLFILPMGCSTADYSAYMQHMPKSVLVLPPLNQTSDVAASNAFLSTVSRPLAEAGYYVFPIAVVDRMMKENGVPTPGDMHSIPLKKLGEVFNADAVLYIHIKDWNTRYLVVASSTSVTIEYLLVDVKTGTRLWQWEQTVNDNSDSSNSGNLAAMLVSAAVHAAANVASGKERELARQANYTAFNDRRVGLLKGWRHPDFEKDQAAHASQ